MAEHKGIRWRLIRWATTCRDDATARMQDAHTEAEDAFQDGRRNAFQAMIDHIEGGAVDLDLPNGRSEP